MAGNTGALDRVPQKNGNEGYFFVCRARVGRDGFDFFGRTP